MNMNRKGFTIVELMAVIVVLSLIMIISIPMISNAGKNTKLKTLDSKVSNIEKAAILYAQQTSNRSKFNTNCSNSGEMCDGISNCKCFDDIVTVGVIASFGFIEYDEGSRIVNPTNDKNTSADLNNCEITIYKKYGKIYAYYNDRDTEGGCWDASDL